MFEIRPLPSPSHRAAQAPPRSEPGCSILRSSGRKTTPNGGATLPPMFPGASDELAREAADFLADQAPGESLEVPRGGPSKQILLPYTDSRPAQRALEAVVDLSSVFNAEVQVLHFRTWEPGRGGPIFFETRNDAASLTQAAVAKLRGSGLTAMGIVHDAARLRVPYEIVARADQLRSCAIVLGARRHRVIAAALLGSISRNVIFRASCPVVVIRCSRDYRSVPRYQQPRT
jgi:nucleotide-binding universal stress UspA family protein